MALLAFAPDPLIIIVIRSVKKGSAEKFGPGRGCSPRGLPLFLLTSILLALGATLRAAIGFLLRSASNPGGYHSRAFYRRFSFVIEVLVFAKIYAGGGVLL